MKKARKTLKTLDVKSYFDDLEIDNITDEGNSNINDLFRNVESKIRECLDKHVPEREIETERKEGNIWFNINLQKQKKIIKNREQIFKSTKRIIRGMLTKLVIIHMLF